LLNPSNKEHAALLYDREVDLNTAVSKYINEGLNRGQLCVYATVRYRDQGHLEKFSSMITNYESNIENENLLVIDLAPLYISALVGDLKPFEKAMAQFTEKAAHRNDRHIRFVGDGSGFLFSNRHFDQCRLVEEWWQSKPFDGSYLCPFSRQVFNAFPQSMHAGRSVVDTHDVIVDGSGEVLSKTDESIKRDNWQHKSAPDLMQGHNNKLNSAVNGEAST
jgi:hypothetical protein